MLMKSLASVSAPFAKRALFMNTPRAAIMPFRLSHDNIPAELRPPTMDDLPIPCGSWKEHYENQQRKYNLQLISSFGFFVITVVTVLGSGQIDFNLLYPPPAPRSEVLGS